MESNRKSIHGEWSSRWAFVLAATGAAVGLGNIWKFPYITGQNGGGAFVLIYLLCVIFIGIPLLMAEIMLGRRGRQNPVHTLKTLATESGHSKQWQWLGVVGVLAGFLILSYYSVIAGWSLDYIFHAVSGVFARSDAQSIKAIFNHLQHSPMQMLAWHTVIMLITTLIVSQGVQHGLEKAVQFMFPIMLLLLLVLVVYAADIGHFKQGLIFLFHPDFSKLSSTGCLAALGHAFFTLSVATGSIMMYGAYLPQNASITRAAVSIAAADTIVALLAGIAIFPIVFANGLQPSAGPGLIFITLPIAFGHMPYGEIFATLFFIMLFFAALTSAISLIEPSVAFLMESCKITRRRSTMLNGFVIWLLGIGTILSFNHWHDIKLFTLNIFDFLDYLTANIMLPLGGLFIAVFAAWLMQTRLSRYELNANEHSTWYQYWRFCLGVLTPIAIFIVFLDFIGVF